MARINIRAAIYPNKYMHTDSPEIVMSLSDSSVLLTNFRSASVADYETATPGLPKWHRLGRRNSNTRTKLDSLEYVLAGGAFRDYKKYRELT